MKFWLTLGSGILIGAIAGAFVVTFVLLDDVSQKPASVAATAVQDKVSVSSSATRPAKVHVEPEVSVQPAAPLEAKPVGVSAEAVKVDDLPAAEPVNVLSTVKRDETSGSDSTVVQ